MRVWWPRGVVFFVIIMGLAACGGADVQEPTCGAQVCVTDVRAVRVDPNTVGLYFRMTEVDGSFNPEQPPFFATGLHVRITDQSGDLRLLDRDYGANAFSCVSSDSIPGTEGTVAAACILPLTTADFASLPEPGSSVTLLVYGDTFPIVLWEIAYP